MGIGLIWQNSVWIALQDNEIVASPEIYDKYDLILCNDRLVINLIPLDNDYVAQELIDLQSEYQLRNIVLVHLWEDIWLCRKEQVLGRFKSILGLNKSLHARKGLISVIDQKQADDFLIKNHIQASAKARYKYALNIDGQIVAVACFSNVRWMKGVSESYRSVELIRFATLMGFTVTGGFTKLLKHFIKLIEPDDVMSYADRDWSLGNAYELSGFKLVETTPPANIWLQRKELIRYFPHRLPISAKQSDDENKTVFIEALDADEFAPVFNTGNLKYILYLNKS